MSLFDIEGRPAMTFLQRTFTEVFLFRRLFLVLTLSTAGQGVYITRLTRLILFCSLAPS